MKDSSPQTYTIWDVKEQLSVAYVVPCTSTEKVLNIACLYHAPGLQGSKICDPNISLQHVVDYFLLKTQKYLRGPEDLGRSFDLPPNCLKEFRQKTCARKGAITIGNCSIISSMCGKQVGTQQSLLKFLSLSHCFCQSSAKFVYQAIAFPFSCELPSSPLTSQTMTLKFSFVFS